MVLQHRAVDSPEETFGVAVDFVLLAALAVAHGHVAAAVEAAAVHVAHTAVGRRSEMRIGELVAQRVFDGARHARAQRDLVEHVAVALEQLHPVPAQPKYLVAADALQEAPQRLGVEAAGDDRQFGHRALQPEHAEQAGATQHRQAVQRVPPEVVVIGQSLERLEQSTGLGGRILLAQRGFQCIHPMPVTDRILHIFGVVPVRRLIQGQAGRCRVRRQLDQVRAIGCECHGCS